MRKYTILVVMVLAVSSIASAEIITVDPNGFYDFGNIQDAINYSWNGDTVIVRPGTYDGSIYFNGRAITLTSIDPDDPAIVESTRLISYTGPVVTFDFGENQESVLTGFYIWASHQPCDVYCYASSPTISKNYLYISVDGSAIAGWSNASPTISDNTIIGSTNIGIKDCHGDIINNIFLENTSTQTVTAITNANGFISGNKIFIEGGGITYSAAVIENNLIVGAGTGISSSTGPILNNTIVNCRTAIYGAGDIVKNNIIAYSTTTGISGNCQNSFNCFWGNSGNFGGGASAGPSDINVDPLFADYASGDYHLKSEAGRCLPDGETWVVDEVTSRCIDEGDPDDFIGIEPNSNGGIINIGCYGGTAEASKSTSGIIESICPIPPMADINNDCIVNLGDFAIMVSEWLTDNTL